MCRDTAIHQPDVLGSLEMGAICPLRPTAESQIRGIRHQFRSAWPAVTKSEAYETDITLHGTVSLSKAA
jgi:hypothetical protein